MSSCEAFQTTAPRWNTMIWGDSCSTPERTAICCDTERCARTSTRYAGMCGCRRRKASTSPKAVTHVGQVGLCLYRSARSAVKTSSSCRSSLICHMLPSLLLSAMEGLDRFRRVFLYHLVQGFSTCEQGAAPRGRAHLFATDARPLTLSGCSAPIHTIALAFPRESCARNVPGKSYKPRTTDFKCATRLFHFDKL
jgi:hypothetical protein